MHALAHQGELAVTKVLEHQGWHILARNYRSIGCELDIIAIKCGTMIAVEVKYRRQVRFVDTEFTSFISYRKKLALKRGLLSFLSKKQIPHETLRFDLALVTGADLRVHYYPNIFPIE